MQKLINAGKYLFAAAMAGFGVIQFITGSLPSEFMPLPPTLPGKAVLAFLTGLILVAAAACIFLNKMAKTAAAAVGIVFFIFLVYPHTPRLLSNVRNPSEWVAFLETLSFSCGAFILADRITVDAGFMLRWSNAIHKTAIAGCYLFAIAILIFGIQHIMYEKFILTLIPGWIPAKLFWSYVVKIAFIATAVSIIINIQKRLGAFLLGVMLLIWALILHAPRVAAKPNIEPEWTSLFVALAMSGICFLIAGRVTKKSRNMQNQIMPKESGITDDQNN